MINLVKTNKVVSHNANTRNKRKVLNGFKGEGTPSGWVKTSPYGTIKHEPTLEEREHARRVKNFRSVNFYSKHAGSKRNLNRY